MERGFRNTNMKPLNHSTYLRLQLLCKRIYDSDEKLSVLNDLSLDDLNNFIPELRSQVTFCDSVISVLLNTLVLAFVIILGFCLNHEKVR